MQEYCLRSFMCGVKHSRNHASVVAPCTVVCPQTAPTCPYDKEKPSSKTVMMWLLALTLLLHSSLVVQAKADGPAAAVNSNLQILIPSWTVDTSADLALNFTAADAAAREQEAAPITFRGKPLDSVSLRKGYFYGNLAILRYGSQYITAVRKIQFYITPRTAVADYPLDPDPKKKWLSWWSNRISLCTADAATLQPQACTNFDPRNWTDCMWNGGFETLGPEDPRLIVWPSKGLFMMFNSKPWPVNPSGTKPEDTQCAGPWAQQPFLIPLATYTGAGSPGLPGSLAVSQLGQQQQQQTPSSSTQQQQQRDPWTQGLIRLQYLPPELQGDTQVKLEKLQKAHKGSGPFLHKQKNWNPFIYKDELYFSQSFMPHVVIKPQPDGTCDMVHMTDGLPFKALPAKPRGNTQAVLLPAAVTGLSKDVYLGIVHTEVDRAYENFFYQMQAEPPFSIAAVSAPIPLVPGAHPRVPAWDHISFPMSLQYLEDSNQFMIGYGSGDQVPRVKFMPLSEVLALFSSSSSAGSQEGTVAVGTSTAAAAAAVDAGGGVGAKVDGKLDANGLSPKAQAAGKAAVAAVEEAMGLRSTTG